MTINDTVELFVRLSQQTHLQDTPEDLLNKLPAAIKLALEQHNSQAIKESFCSSNLLANKTTVFDA